MPRASSAVAISSGVALPVTTSFSFLNSSTANDLPASLQTSLGSALHVARHFSEPGRLRTYRAPGPNPFREAITPRSLLASRNALFWRKVLSAPSSLPLARGRLSAPKGPDERRSLPQGRRLFLRALWRAAMSDIAAKPMALYLQRSAEVRRGPIQRRIARLSIVGAFCYCSTQANPQNC
jgi:hypothetical protein